MSGPRYYPKPGTLTLAWWQTGRPLRQVHGEVVVLANSRHIETITEERGLELLSEAYGCDVQPDRVATWHSVTQRDVENNAAGDAGQGDWSEAGSGAAWVRVLYPLIEEETNG